MQIETVPLRQLADKRYGSPSMAGTFRPGRIESVHMITSFPEIFNLNESCSFIFISFASLRLCGIRRIQVQGICPCIAPPCRSHDEETRPGASFKWGTIEIPPAR